MNILTTVELSDKDRVKIISFCAKLGITMEEFIRHAVEFYIEECVPTQYKISKLNHDELKDIFLGCVPTQTKGN